MEDLSRAANESSAKKEGEVTQSMIEVLQKVSLAKRNINLMLMTLSDQNKAKEPVSIEGKKLMQHLEDVQASVRASLEAALQQVQHFKTEHAVVLLDAMLSDVSVESISDNPLQYEARKRQVCSIFIENLLECLDLPNETVQSPSRSLQAEIISKLLGNTVGVRQVYRWITGDSIMRPTKFDEIKKIIKSKNCDPAELIQLQRNYEQLLKFHPLGSKARKQRFLHPASSVARLDGDRLSAMILEALGEDPPRFPNAHRRADVIY